MKLKDFLRDTLQLNQDDVYKVDVKDSFAFFNTDNAHKDKVLEFFTDFNLTNAFFGSGDFYCYARQSDLSNKYTTNINSNGQSTSARDACP